jgi:hypothetical protein
MTHLGLRFDPPLWASSRTSASNTGQCNRNNLNIQDKILRPAPRQRDAEFDAAPLAARPHGQMYPVPPGALKQPTDSGSTCLGSHRIALGKKMVNAMVPKKMT